MNSFEAASLKVDSMDPDTRMSLMRKRGHCHWNRRTHFDKKVPQICRYNARLEGDDIHVLQDLTATKCVFKDLYCIPVEQPNSTIIWDSWESLGVKPHNYKIYHPMGTFPVKKVDNYFLIPGLDIG